MLLDAFGTLVSLEEPGPRLRQELHRRLRVEVSEEAARAAFRAEIDFYVAHHLEGRDAASLDGLRDRCAAVVAERLALGAADRVAVREAMLASLRFGAYPDAAPALAALREAALRLAVASNWDCSLPEVLDRVGLAPLVDAVVASASVGAAKPDPRLFEAALRAVGCGPGEALFVGDSIERDVRGARDAGIRAALLRRDGSVPDEVAGVAPAIRSLAEVPSLI